jgi:hypothetical protein
MADRSPVFFDGASWSDKYGQAAINLMVALKRQYFRDLGLFGRGWIPKSGSSTMFGNEYIFKDNFSHRLREARTDVV